MDLISLNFLFFALIALAVYYLLPFRFQNAWLLIVSLAFYLTWGVGFTVLLLGVSLVNFFIARTMTARPTAGKPLLALGLFLNLAALVLDRKSVV